MDNFLGILLTVEFIWIVFAVIMILLTKRPSTDRFSWKNITKYSLIAFWLTFIGKMFSLDVKTGAYWSVFTLAVAGLMAIYRYVNKTGIWSRTSGKFLAGIMLAIWTLVTIFMISAGVSAGWFILNGFIILIFLIIWLPSSWLEKTIRRNQDKPAWKAKAPKIYGILVLSCNELRNTQELVTEITNQQNSLGCRYDSRYKIILQNAGGMYNDLAYAYATIRMNFTHISAEQLLTKIYEYDFRSSAGEFGKYYVLRDPSDQVAVSALADLVRPINAG